MYERSALSLMSTKVKQMTFPNRAGLSCCVLSLPLSFSPPPSLVTDSCFLSLNFLLLYDKTHRRVDGFTLPFSPCLSSLMKFSAEIEFEISVLEEKLLHLGLTDDHLIYSAHWSRRSSDAPAELLSWRSLQGPEVLTLLTPTCLVSLFITAEMITDQSVS